MGRSSPHFGQISLLVNPTFQPAGRHPSRSRDRAISAPTR